MSTDRTTLRLSDERKRLFDQASEIVAKGPNDDLPRSDVIDAALVHLIQSERNIEDARKEHEPEIIQEIANTEVLKLHYRTSVDTEGDS